MLLMKLLPFSWWWSSALLGESMFLCLPAPHFVHLVQLPRSSGGCFAAPLCWRMLCRPSSLADALPPLLLLALCGYFAALVCWSGGCFATSEFGDLCTLDGGASFSRFSCLACLGLQACMFLPLLFLLFFLLCWVVCHLLSGAL